MIKIYKKLPLFLQHIIITIKNNQTYHKKFKSFPVFRPLKKVIRDLDEDKWINDDKVVERVNALIETATQNVPYYIGNKLNYPYLESIEDLKKLPVLRKEILKKRNKEFISKLSNSSNSYAFKTSGSSGTPLEGTIKLKELNYRFLSFLSSLKKNNINYSKRVGRFLGAEVGDAKNIYRKDYLNNHFLFSIYHISENNIQKYYDAIIKNRIEIIEGYPSTIFALVKMMKLKSLKAPKIEHVLTTAEKLLNHQREEIEEYLDCKIFDFYGSSEGSTYMFSQGDQYINANKVGIVEIVNDDFQEVEPGNIGRMLVTSFTSSYTPLIRYDIGDFCIASTKQTNNSNEILIEEIIGRDDDVFITEEGVQFTRFSLCLKYLPKSITKSQLYLVQRSKNVKVVYTKMNGEITELKLFKPFENKFLSMLGDNYKFQYEFVKEFEKKSRGKLRAVIITE